jgi:hypothetical protein
MSDQQPEALLLAECLEQHEYCTHGQMDRAAAELRRLHEVALEQQGKIYALEMARSMEQKTAKLKQDALLEALKRAEPLLIGPILLQARAAIKQAQHLIM